MKPSQVRARPIAGEDAPAWRLARFVRAVVAPVVLSLYRTRFIGVERLPQGPVILAGNHVSYLDPILLWAGAPRPLHFVAKAELWEAGWLGWCLDHFWAIPVRRATADREMISTATSLLDRGESLGMFPEGTRNRGTDSSELGEAQGGVAFIALRADVPVVPVGIAGTDKALPAGAKIPRFPRITFVFGDPVFPSRFEGGRKERIAAMTSELMVRIATARDTARSV